MKGKMSLCSVSYNFEHYAGIDVEKLCNEIYEYVRKEFAEFNPQVSAPGSDMEMPDHVDVLLCKKDGSSFFEMDIWRRAINIPQDCQEDGLMLTVFIQNCDGTTYKKRHEYPKPWWKRKNESKNSTIHMKIKKTFYKNDDPEEILLRRAHKCSIRNKEQVEKSDKCGCFSCGNIFLSSEIVDYVPDEGGPTALCPYCHVDSVIGDASGITITTEFMKKMMKRWF